MLAAVEAALPADVFIARGGRRGLAGRSVSRAQKIKKGRGGAPTPPLVENPDILADIASNEPRGPALVVGFAAETEHVVDECARQTAAKRAAI